MLYNVCSFSISTTKQVESCVLNHNSSIHCCCTDSLLMTHRGELRLSVIIWRIGGWGPRFLMSRGPIIILAALIALVISFYLLIILYHQ